MFSEVFTLVSFIVLAGFALVAVYSLIMGALLKDRRQIKLGVKCLLGAILTIIIFFFIAMRFFGGSVC